VHVVVLDRRVRRDLPEVIQRSARVAGLLDELACARGVGIFSGIDHPARDLETDGVDPRPVLTEQDDGTVAREGDDVDPVGALDQREVDRRPAARCAPSTNAVLKIR
jgi:hypothetical protein